MLHVKIMSDENLFDLKAEKNFKIVSVGDKDVMEFAKITNTLGAPTTAPDGSRFVLYVTRSDGVKERHNLYGNAYVINDSGKTIATHSA